MSSLIFKFMIVWLTKNEICTAERNNKQQKKQEESQNNVTVR